MTDTGSVGIQFSGASYQKLILHLIKYPSLTVNGTDPTRLFDLPPHFQGVFLGLQRSSTLLIEDSIPLFHGPCLSPMLEIALLQVESYANSRDLHIVGYYHAPASKTDEKLPPIAEQIASQIQSNYEGACLFLVKNIQTYEDHISGTFFTFSKKTRRWETNQARTPSFTKDTSSKIWEELSENIEKRVFLNLSDFDNHLHDIQNDWRNTTLLK
eukprot:TRINITY_DN1229_c0_g1_i8.p1 TRINITY_DN1229_c0_g1~~TRINITY_DN1229_c0_g1_i8.p1  ORF type:complete len:213 (-),score=27.55 TRINITY_DN1229_c0_g1_i8:350-988(-)